LTRGRAATPDPFDLSAVNSSDELFDALSARRGGEHAETDDPVAALLTALVSDEDAGAPPLPAPARVTCGRQAARRRGTRAVVTLGVAALVLTSAGAAAAGGGDGLGVGAMGTARVPAGPTGPERSNENLQRHDPPAEGPATERRPSARRTGDRRRDTPEGVGSRAEDDATPVPEKQSWEHRPHWPGRAAPHSPGEVSHSPDPRSSPEWQKPVPWPEYVHLRP